MEKMELNPGELMRHFRELWGHEPEVLMHLFPALRHVLADNVNPEAARENGGEVDKFYPTDIFFTDAVAVPPPKTRPCLFAAGVMTIHPQSSGLQNVVAATITLRELLRVLRSGKGMDMEGLTPEVRKLFGSTSFVSFSLPLHLFLEESISLNCNNGFYVADSILRFVLHYFQAKAMILATRGEKLEAKVDAEWKELQGVVNQVLDKDMRTDANAKVGYGFKQLIERKTGLFRMHMMGKRVNFAARTVITPDPNIDVDEIGLPDVFAKSLTYR